MNKAELQVEREKKSDVSHERGQFVLKANSLIQKTRYSLSLQEQKIILYMISKLEPHDEDFKYYEFDLKNLCELCDIEYHGGNYQNFKESIENLSNKSFWIDTGEEEILCHWVDTVIIDKVVSTKITIRFNEKLKPYLLQLKNNYTMYELENTLMMNSKYSIRIYEILKSYAYKNEWRVSIEEFKKILDIEKKYTNYKNLRVNVIDKAIEEINQFTDLKISYTPIRTVRTITHIHFSISKKNNEEITDLILSRAIYRKSKEEQRHE